ncbi:MAG: undecaprenyl-diphosphatase [Gammaproteobacteria bacterium]|uniref:undecaprenyl-diphosphate phosphatase n=1 Tax=endosymbiont of Bathymodiolus septemdierum str. Myojin knoll TaxID=1303921 RepID=A0A0P0UT39_9GAMM|nr:undecaprenyl-diphosphatase [Bathymodiolus septemdierum thioautotrophic gill symbiont]RUA06342.1 MAG: undecaprenyl-diphosphatase [Gammaproteobacteria bacterium]BAS68186.1 undecaprenyl-diphosphatase [endosymbiont of Bathymodiolus septemdierum str. Myojin knoll]
MNTFNQDLFLFLNAFTGKNTYLDQIILGFGEVTPYAFIVLIIGLFFFTKRKNEAIFSTFSTVLALSISKIIGLLYFHNRPFMDHIGTTLKAHALDSSLPSDHTTLIFAILSTLLLFKSTRKIALISLPIGIIGSFARVFEGIHYPLDIIAGIAVGLLSAVIVYQSRERLIIINDIIFKVEKFIFRK